ncbi:class E sortase [Planosporangium flavigriseum]|nr:sortase [Planosporangium flavigriseum]NJC66393.1 class E sortase [Planosporangium flavigriseum]
MGISRRGDADRSGSVTTGRPDRTQRLLSVAAAVLLAGGLALVGGTGWNWWSRINQIQTNQAGLERAVDAAWARPVERQQAARADGAAPAPAVRGAAGQAGQGTAAQAAQGAGAQEPQGGPVPGASPSPSGAIARLHIPRLRLDLVVVEGARDEDLLRGPGHIPDTPSFGQPGNVGIGGHRYPGVFWDLDRLHEGDPVVVETDSTWYIYRVSREMIVGPSDVQVLAPRPAGAPAGARDFLTLVTCDPVFTTLRRLVRQAVLVRATPRSAGAPPELTGN